MIGMMEKVIWSLRTAIWRGFLFLFLFFYFYKASMDITVGVVAYIAF